MDNLLQNMTIYTTRIFLLHKKTRTLIYEMILKKMNTKVGFKTTNNHTNLFDIFQP